jgi:hypothetical protein
MTSYHCAASLDVRRLHNIRYLDYLASAAMIPSISAKIC